jgi:hypothetical protein
MNAACYLQALLELHCALHDRCPGKKRIPATHLYTASVHGEDSVDWLETSTTSTLQSRHNPVRHSSFWINRISNVRLALGDQQSCPESCFVFELLELSLYGSGIFKPQQKCISWYGDFVEKLIQFADLT